MAETPDISKVVESAVAESLEAHLAELRTVLRAEIVEKINDSLKPILEQTAKGGKKEEHAPGTGPTDILNAAVASIYDAPGQGDILKALLDGLSQFTARAALFVVKGGSISAWQARGFEKDIKGFTADSNGLGGRAIRDKEPVNAAAAEFDSKFISIHGNPFDGNCCVLPIVVRDRVAALLYVDGGTEAGGSSDESAARVLVRSTASWLELLALRKGAGAAAADTTEAVPPPPPAPVEEAPPSKASEPTPPPPTPPPASEPTKAPAAPAGPDLSGLSKEDQEVHKKAKRFAKLLVDEIKLYNKAKVEEGRQNKDVYKRLQEDIDKSRATYDKRYSRTAAGSADYFTSEVIRILADNDVSLLGADFPQ